jgi:selenocysteine lyase/cysteine desulfurase
MRGKLALSTDAGPRSPTAELHAPLPELLISGGDDRLRLMFAGGINGYGCAASPRPDVAEFASSTATTISERAWRRVDQARSTLADAAQAGGLEAAFDSRIEQLRDELRGTLELDPATEIVFAPSGTDAALHATFLATALLGTPLVNITMTPDETGSGIPFASIGRHFSSCTGLGAEVRKGDPVAGMPQAVSALGFPGRDARGRPLTAADVDEAVLALVRRTIAGGARVVLNAMDCSRTGLAGPTPECLHQIASLWPEQVLVLVDACQMRLSRADLRRYLAHNFLVLITGSKFFMGPPFSGALLVPEGLATVLSRLADVPPGLRSYTVRSSWPQNWEALRSQLPRQPNFGEWLRWEAALEEMSAYFAIPKSVRTAGLNAFTARLDTYCSQINGIEAAPSFKAGANGLRRSIVPFVLTDKGRPFTVDEAVEVYRGLNEEIASAAPGACHFGQPVALRVGKSLVTGAFRASLGARTLSQAWIPGDLAASERNLARELDRLGNALERVAFRAARNTF